MKQTLLLFAALFCTAVSSFATTHIITVGPGGTLTFSPSSGVTVNLGDTVKWQWASGTHTTTSTSIPAGAANWSANIRVDSPSFIYVPTVQGVYDYQCNFHQGAGMVGTFTVVGSAEVSGVNVAPLFAIYPNPSHGIVHLQFSKPAQPVSVVVTDMSGKQVLKMECAASGGVDIDVKNIASGIYVITARQGGQEYKQELQVTH